MKKMNQNSIEVYMKNIDSGYFSRRQQEVYNFVYNHPGTTMRECLNALNMEMSSSGRITELVRMKAIQLGENTTCPVTGNTVSTYYTSNIEIKGKLKRMTKADKRAEAYKLIKYLKGNMLIDDSGIMALNHISEIIAGL